MAAQSKPARNRKGRSKSSLGAFLLGFLCAILALALGAYAWLHLGHSPAALGRLVSHPLAPTPTSTPTPVRTSHPNIPPHPTVELVQPPFGISEEVYEAGAKIYRKSCASCHGAPGHDSILASSTTPPALQLWKRHPHSSVVGLSSHEPGEIFSRIKYGVPLAGMPAYQHVYSDTQIWQVSLLLKNAGQPLPDPVLDLLSSTRKAPATP